MQPIPMMATGTGGEGSDEFKSLPFRTSLRGQREPRGMAGGRMFAMKRVMLG